MSAEPGDGGASGNPRRWADLRSRLLSGVVLACGSLLAVWVGGMIFAVVVALAVAVIVWELAAMLSSNSPRLLGAVAGAACLAVVLLPAGWGLPLIMAPVLVSFGRIGRSRLTFAIFTLLTILAGFGLVHIREDVGLAWMVWLGLVVMITDVLGYFAGRLIGGPKFWPAVSPKKTWSGTIAGWIGAAAIGAALVLTTDAGAPLIAISVAMSMAAQMGDIAESAVKRHHGVKDSSRLLPGHGGFFDRFDGVLGAAIFLLLVERIVDFPPST